MDSAFSQSPPALSANQTPVGGAAIGHQEQLRKLSDVDLLACFIWGEARGEKVEGKLAVARVVLNRVQAGSYYGRTIREVILKVRQSLCFNANDPDSALIPRLLSADREFALCRAIAELATRGHLKNDPTGGATHFHKADAKPPWATNLTYLWKIGNHVFYRESVTRVREDHGLVVQKRGLGRES